MDTITFILVCICVLLYDRINRVISKLDEIIDKLDKIEKDRSN